jgi:hypothetical protein
MTADSGVFLLHKFEKHIGKETYKVYHDKDSKKYVVDDRTAGAAAILQQ